MFRWTNQEAHNNITITDLDPKAHHVDYVRIAWFEFCFLAHFIHVGLNLGLLFLFLFIILFLVFSWIHAWAGSLLWAESFLCASHLGLKLAWQLAWSHFVWKAFINYKSEATYNQPQISIKVQLNMQIWEYFIVYISWSSLS